MLGYIDPGSGFVIMNLGGWLLAILIGFLGGISLFFKRIRRFFKRNRWVLPVLLLALAAVVAFIFRGVIMNSGGFSYQGRIVMLGFDGLSPDIVEPMMERGELPNYARLRDTGSFRRLATTNPSQSPVAWASFATGQNPGKNGMYDFIVRDPSDYGLNLSLSKMEKGKPVRVVKSRSFWQYASERGVPSVIISCPVTYPPDEIRGKMLSGMGVPDILGTEGTFSFYTSEPLPSGKETGGKVFQVEKGRVVSLDLIGPRTMGPGGKPRHVTVPVTVTDLGGGAVRVEYQKQSFELGQGEWSEWQPVTFKLGFMKKMKGIAMFHLVESEPAFKLYVSPINFDPRDPYFPVSHPGGYSRELAEEIGLFHTQGLPLDTWAVNEKRLGEEPFLEQATRVLNDRTRILERELADFGNGIFFCYFGSSDIVQHMFWRYLDPDHPLYEADAPQKYRDVIGLWYRKTDAILGRVLDALGERDTVIVLSDHGFETFRMAAHVNSWLRANGYLELKDAEAGEGAELLVDVDWSRTRAYALGFGGVYVNQRGRERDGIVNPGADTEALKKEIAAGLLGWRDDRYDEPVVRAVYPREDIFWGEYAAEAPDLYIGFNRGYRSSWQTAIGGVPESLLEPNLKKWSGDHLFDPGLIPGVLFSNRKIAAESPAISDIAPTVLSLIGFGPDELKGMDLDGTPLFEEPRTP